LRCCGAREHTPIPSSFDFFIFGFASRSFKKFGGDAPSSSLMDSTISPKVTSMEGKGVGARFLAHNISGVEGRVGTSRWGLKILTSKSITYTDLHKPNNKLVNA
jgi:hypothetical protein